MNIDALIGALGLVPHPEGGYYTETYRSPESLSNGALPDRYDGARSVSTAIYYLLTRGDFSALHRISSDEIFHFYLGDPASLFLLHPDGKGETVILGPDIGEGQRPQVMVPAGTWQGLRLAGEGRFALLGTTVSPGFDFADLEMGERDELLRAFPDHADDISALTRTG